MSYHFLLNGYQKYINMTLVCLHVCIFYYIFVYLFIFEYFFIVWMIFFYLSIYFLKPPRLLYLLCTLVCFFTFSLPPSHPPGRWSIRSCTDTDSLLWPLVLFSFFEFSLILSLYASYVFGRNAKCHDFFIHCGQRGRIHAVYTLFLYIYVIYYSPIECSHAFVSHQIYKKLNFLLCCLVPGIGELCMSQNRRAIGTRDSSKQPNNRIIAYDGTLLQYKIYYQGRIRDFREKLI